MLTIALNGNIICTLSDFQIQVILSYVPKSSLEKEITKKIKWVINCIEYEANLSKLFADWMPKLKNRYKSIPTNDEDLAKLIFSQPDYKPA